MIPTLSASAVRTLEIERLPGALATVAAPKTSFFCPKISAKTGSKMTASRLLLASQFAANGVPKVD